MPEISRFFGIVIYMYFDDHNPPHFHARYGSGEALIRIADGEVIRGNISKRTASLVQEWCGLHKSELLAAIRLVRSEIRAALIRYYEQRPGDRRAFCIMVISFLSSPSLDPACSCGLSSCETILSSVPVYSCGLSSCESIPSSVLVSSCHGWTSSGRLSWSSNGRSCAKKLCFASGWRSCSSSLRLRPCDRLSCWMRRSTFCPARSHSSYRLYLPC
jgi:hypothetical protein